MQKLELHHLERGSGPHDDERCTCKHDTCKWLHQCEAATANDQKIHARWAADYIRANPDTQFTAAYRKLAGM